MKRFSLVSIIFTLFALTSIVFLSSCLGNDEDDIEQLSIEERIFAASNQLRSWSFVEVIFTENEKETKFLINNQNQTTFSIEKTNDGKIIRLFDGSELLYETGNEYNFSIENLTEVQEMLSDEGYTVLSDEPNRLVLSIQDKEVIITPSFIEITYGNLKIHISQTSSSIRQDFNDYMSLYLPSTPSVPDERQDVWSPLDPVGRVGDGHIDLDDDEDDNFRHVDNYEIDPTTVRTTYDKMSLTIRFDVKEQHENQKIINGRAFLLVDGNVIQSRRGVYLSNEGFRFEFDISPFVNQSAGMFKIKFNEINIRDGLDRDRKIAIEEDIKEAQFIATDENRELSFTSYKPSNNDYSLSGHYNHSGAMTIFERDNHSGFSEVSHILFTPQSQPYYFETQGSNLQIFDGPHKDYDSIVGPYNFYHHLRHYHRRSSPPRENSSAWRESQSLWNFHSNNFQTTINHGSSNFTNKNLPSMNTNSIGKDLDERLYELLMEGGFDYNLISSHPASADRIRYHYNGLYIIEKGLQIEFQYRYSLGSLSTKPVHYGREAGYFYNFNDLIEIDESFSKNSTLLFNHLTPIYNIFENEFSIQDRRLNIRMPIHSGGYFDFRVASSEFFIKETIVFNSLMFDVFVRLNGDGTVSEEMTSSFNATIHYSGRSPLHNPEGTFFRTPTLYKFHDLVSSPTKVFEYQEARLEMIITITDFRRE